MEKNITNKIVKNSGLVLSFTLLALASQTTHAQTNNVFVNKGDVKVSNGTILSIHMDYENKDSGNFINDGLVHVFQNWKNDGTVSFTPSSNGKTFFTGEEEQIIESSVTSDFQNVLFNNIKTQMPFSLAGAISVSGTAEFKKGIIDADSFDGVVIFKENGLYTNAGDQSFVDGKVQKRGNKMFEFPIGNQFQYRPSIHAAGNSNGNIYTTQYFYKNSDNLYAHTSKEDGILLINNTEYWNVTKDQGSEKIILSLTMDADTTPSEFFNPGDGKKVVIVRWDESLGKWLNEDGEVSNASSDKLYSNLVTTQVKGYGIFTLAIVNDKTVDDNELIVYNGISPNDDGKNDAFLIKGINKYPDNEVEIYNRWGVKVYDAKSYNESDVMFRGYSDGRATVKRGEKLPTGTYFYILRYNNGQKGVEKSGYLYINNQ